MSDKPFPDLPSGYPFPQLEKAVLAFWKQERIFEQTLAARKGQPLFRFFEGPPTANNVPHVGHVLTRVVKDLFPRFQTMRGRFVPRRAGWDTHGLPVEIEVEKRLGLAGKRDIEALVSGDRRASIAAFNAACLESVSTYERDWRRMSERVGYWIDLDDPYVTYSNRYIESLWSALKLLSEKHLLYRGHKSQPYCPRCGTTLSSHEVAQSYREVDDPSIWVLFPVRPGRVVRTRAGAELRVPDNLFLVAWTTTPWTLPGHSGLAVHPELVYKLVEHPGRPGQRLLIASDLEVPVPVELSSGGANVRVDLRDQRALAEFQGTDLVGLRYDRPYRTLPWDARTEREPWGPPPCDENGWLVVPATYVTTSDGTGIVHTAPAFGAEDYQTGEQFGLPLIRSVDPNGKIAARHGIEHLAGLWFKDADRVIVRELAERGLLLHSERYRHAYPFCWRCETPLLQYATESWFIRTTALRDELVVRNQEIDWHPAAIGSGRFGNWLETVVDWALSRKRYWGTPLPIWACSECPRVEVVGSYRELFERIGKPLPSDPYDRSQFDPHRPWVDELLWACPDCAARGQRGEMRRVEEVADAWFDSGAMSFAQDGRLPYEEWKAAGQGNGDRTLDFEPADFISEAVDQTRGWFYTLHVLAVALFGKPAFKHCVVLGHVTDEKGRKMSKRLGNVVEPLEVVEATGADALRWYFFVRDPEQTSRFSARLVREGAQSFLLPLWNAARFFTIYANLDGWKPTDSPAPPLAERSDLDLWILARLAQTVELVTSHLEGYSVAGAARELERLVEDLTNWYLRRSRPRFWSSLSDVEPGDKLAAYWTLYQVLETLTRLSAPLVPFVAEELHRVLVRSHFPDRAPSVHLESWPGLQDELVELHENQELQDRIRPVELAQRLVRLARSARASHNLKVRQPLLELVVVGPAGTAAETWRPQLERVRQLIIEEVNVQGLRVAEDRATFVRHEVRPNFRILGKRLGPAMKRVQAALAAADGDQLATRLEQEGSLHLQIEGEELVLQASDVEVRLIEKEGTATASDGQFLVALDTTLTEELIAAGRARELLHQLQNARKDAGLEFADRILLRFDADPELWKAIAPCRDWIAAELLAVMWLPLENLDTSSRGEVDGLSYWFTLERVSTPAVRNVLEETPSR